MDRKNLFSIGEVSKLFHISVSSLRHYEKLLDYITKEQIQIVGFSREITLIDYGHNSVCKCQVRITIFIVLI